MLVGPYFLVKFFIILRLTANFVESGETVYVSRFSGNDSTTCGKRSLSCRTISYAIHQALDGSHIYLDGANTSQDPYRCQPLDPNHPGIYLTKNISFVGMASRVYISCLHGIQWIVSGAKRKYGLQVNFHGFTFVDTSLVFLDAFVNISDSLFENSKNVTMKFYVFNLARFNLSLSNVVFQRNVVCMAIVSKTTAEIFINMVNTSFIENGFSSGLVPSLLPSILFLESKRSDIDIQLRYCSFKSNTFHKDGMILVNNKGGTINLLLYQFKFKQNGAYINISQDNCIFTLLSAKVIMRLKSGFIRRTSGNFVFVDSHVSNINISNIEMDEFHTMSGGAFYVFVNSGFLSIKDSCFRNGKSRRVGGVFTVVASNLSIIIHNCTFHKISASDRGGVMYFQSKESRNNLELQIINSTFSNCRSRNGGAISTLSTNLVATISDSLFVRNWAYLGAAVQFLIRYSAAIRLSNVNFIENSASGLGIFYAVKYSMKSNFTFSTNNVSFIKNKLNSYSNFFTAILSLVFKNTGSSMVFNSTRFISNTGRNDNRTIALLIVDRNSKSNLTSITITNSTFVNNSCGALFIYAKYSRVKVRNSMFVRNHCLKYMGGAIDFQFDPINDCNLNQTHVQCFQNSHERNVLVENVLFKENVALLGGAMAVFNAKIKLRNCTFINNYAQYKGGHIFSAFSPALTINHCVFKQTIQSITIEKREFIASSFLTVYSSGELLLQNTTADRKIISNEPLILVTRADQVNMDNATTITCPLGSALKKSTYKYQTKVWTKQKERATFLYLSCSKCDYKLYSLQRGRAKGLNVDNSFKCIPCPRGADCFSTIKSKTNFWGYNTSSKPPTLAFTLCPFGYCKPPQPNSSKYNDCQGKRTGVMCGSCSDGYTEALWTTYCTPIKNCNDYWFWILFLALVIFMAVLLVFKPPIVTFLLKHVVWFKRFTIHAANPRELRYHNMDNCWSLNEEERQERRPLSSSEQLKHDKRQCSRFLEIVFYFYQMAQLLLSSYSLGEIFHFKILPPVLGFFNFEPRLHNEGFLCPFPGLTPKTKFAFKILPVFGTMVAIFTIYFFHVLINKLRRSLRPSISPYLQAGIKTIFLSYATLATVGISNIRCVFVAGDDRWFYNGNVVCYQWWQYVSFAFNGIFVIPFIFLLAWASFKVYNNAITVKQFLLAIAFPLPFLMLWLFRLVYPSDGVNVEESENFGAIKEMLLGPYREPGNGRKHGAMYWQSVLIARRFILVLIFCTITEPSIRLFCMTLACVLVLFFHLKVKPFRDSFANNFESFSLLLLVMLGLLNLFKSVFVGFEGNIKGPLVAAFKAFQWLEVVIVGLFPALLSLLACLAIISLILRVLFMCCRSFFKCVFRCCAHRRLFQGTGRLVNFCDDIND